MSSFLDIHFEHSRPWLKKQECEPVELRALSVETGLSEITVAVCMRRGMKTAQSISDFLNPKFENLTDAFKVKDMFKAVERVALARERGQKIMVYGDYDVDGTAGSALLGWIFRDFSGFDFMIRQPDRFKDGYGIGPKAVREAHALGCQVIISVDCGITGFEAADMALSLGIDFIVLDHHQIDAEKGLPCAFAIVNPHQVDCPSGLKELCGCGLAFYFARALRAFGKSKAWWDPGKEPTLKQHLDLVVLATAADMVPLVKDNHILVRQGLEVLRYSKKPGLLAMMQLAGLTIKNLSPSHLGFVLGPRINASGRIENANLALELLTTQDSEQGMILAKKLESLNEERMKIQNAIWDEVRIQAEDGISSGKYQSSVVLASPSWHEGVVGIVASRVSESFKRPGIVIAIREDGIAKGSVRSFAGKDVLEGLRKCRDLLIGYGGHRFAAGLSLDVKNLPAFVLAFDRAMSESKEQAHLRPLDLESECTLEELTPIVMKELESLGPFGPGNSEPIFQVRAKAITQHVMKERHLKLGLKSDRGALDAVWFHALKAEHPPGSELLSKEWLWAAVPEINRYRGRLTPTLRIKDIRSIQ